MNYRRWLPQISLRLVLLLMALLCACLAFWRPAERDPSVRQAIVDYLSIPTPTPALRDDFPTGPMRRSTRDLLRRAIVKATPGDERRQQENLEMLDRLAGLDWPQLKGAPYTHMSDASGDTASFGWLLAQGDGSQCLLDWSFDSTFLLPSPAASTRTDGDISFIRDVGQYMSLIERLPNNFDEALYLGRSAENFFRNTQLLWWNLAYAAAESDLEDTASMLIGRINQTQGGLAGLRNTFVRWRLQNEIDRLNNSISVNGVTVHNDNDWPDFLAECRQLRDRFPHSHLFPELSSLVESVQADLAKQRSFLTERPKDLTDDEIVELLIYRLRDLSASFKPYVYSSGTYRGRGDPMIFTMGLGFPTEADLLVVLGDSSIEHLVEAVEDSTPTRTETSGLPNQEISLMRRQDMALQCLERITGCTFYRPSGERTTLNQETAQRRASVLAHVQNWWQKSKGKPQATMIRNYLATIDQNLVVSDPQDQYGLVKARNQALLTLGYLEGPKNILNQLKTTQFSLHPSRQLLAETSPAVSALRRFKARKQQPRDLEYLYKYGDQKVYEDIAETMEPIAATEVNEEDRVMFVLNDIFVPSMWFRPEHVRLASDHGQNWAIPVLAALLQRTTAIDDEDQLDMSVADLAIVEFQKLTGKDFGYERETNVEIRHRAIAAARDWWLREGKTALAAKIAGDHAPAIAPGDMFLRHAEIVALAKQLTSPDKSVRHKEILNLGSAHSHITQQALLDALAVEVDTNVKLTILELLSQQPRLWFLAALTNELTDERNDIRVRVAAGSIVKQLLDDKDYSVMSIRLETRDTALSAARRLAKDKRAPREVRQVAIEILSAWDSFVDMELLKSFAQ